MVKERYKEELTLFFRIFGGIIIYGVVAVALFQAFAPQIEINIIRPTENICDQDSTINSSVKKDGFVASEASYSVAKASFSSTSKLVGEDIIDVEAFPTIGPDTSPKKVDVEYEEADHTKRFIEKWSPTAISEMHKYGIPASIKMAQAIVESGWGRSGGVRLGNAYFYIKCHGDWDGPTFKQKDDHYENGVLVKSCFRSYKSAWFSWRDHSKFLTSQRNCYKYLLAYKPGKSYNGLESYEHWAYGLEKCKYATKKDYGGNLVRIIKQYKLYKLDDK